MKVHLAQGSLKLWLYERYHERLYLLCRWNLVSWLVEETCRYVYYNTQRRPYSDDGDCREFTTARVGLPTSTGMPGLFTTGLVGPTGVGLVGPAWRRCRPSSGPGLPGPSGAATSFWRHGSCSSTSVWGLSANPRSPTPHSANCWGLPRKLWKIFLLILNGFYWFPREGEMLAWMLGEQAMMEWTSRKRAE